MISRLPHKVGSSNWLFQIVQCSQLHCLHVTTHINAPRQNHDGGVPVDLDRSHQNGTPLKLMASLIHYDEVKNFGFHVAQSFQVGGAGANVVPLLLKSQRKRSKIFWVIVHDQDFTSSSNVGWTCSLVFCCCHPHQSPPGRARLTLSQAGRDLGCQ